MKLIQELIDSAVRELEKGSRSSDMVGNLPYYPMFLTINGKHPETFYRTVKKRAGRTWPQAVEKINFCGYTVEDGTLTYFDPETGTEQEMTAVQEKLTQAAMGDAFHNMMRWGYYNIIDTSEMQSAEEFARYYEARTAFQKLIVDPCQTMVIVLLDDSIAHREITRQIRAYLAEHNEYDGSVILANRQRSGRMMTMPELYRIAASVLILSNNICVTTQKGKEEYNARLSAFYNNRKNTISYSVKESPNRKIALQMIDTFIRHGLSMMESTAPITDLQAWKKIMGIDKGGIALAEETLSQVPVSFDDSLLQYMPLRNCLEKSAFPHISYREFNSYSYPGALQTLIDQLCETQPGVSGTLHQGVSRFKAQVADSVTSGEALGLTSELLDQLFKPLYMGTLNPEQPVEKYIVALTKDRMRKNLLYPDFEDAMVQLYEQAGMMKKNLQQLNGELQQEIPVNGFSDIGQMYANMAENYLNTAKGEALMRRFLQPGASREKQLDTLLEMIQGVILDNSEHFSEPFINMWASLLNLAGNEVYRVITNELDEDSQDHICLFGNYPVEARLQMYLFHTASADGLEKTKLCSYLEQAYADIPNVQLFNTGFDDAIEAVKLFDCGDNRLLL